MKKIIEDNYQSIVDRGFIDPLTTRSDFFDKIDEEVQELKDASDAIDLTSSSSFKYDLQNVKEELADVIMVCLNFAKHYDFDIEQQIKDKIEINKQRAKDGR